MYVGLKTYKIEGKKRLMTAIFETREEAGRILNFHSGGRECITEVTVKRAELNQCDHCERIITRYEFCSDMIHRGEFCSIYCIIKSLQESMNLFQEEELDKND